jgi:hypothetical protein
MNGTIRAPRALGIPILAALLLLTACNGGPQGDGGGGDGGRAQLAASKLEAPLNGAYKVKPNGSRVPPREKELPVPIGSVEAHWYRSGGVYVIAFRGLDLEETGPVCPGSSVQTDAGFEHVTNAPTRGNACEGARNLASPTDGVRTCGPLVLYITEIPEETKGDLFASVERYERKGEILGVTGVVTADSSAAPEIDPEADGYALPQGLVEGTTEVTC